MITVVIKFDGEQSVVDLTYTNLWRELKDIPDAELLIRDNWLSALGDTKNKYICFVEADCLVNSGYFASQMGLFQKNKHFRKLAMLSSAVGVDNWANKFYGYSNDRKWEGVKGKVEVKERVVVPNHQKKSSNVYPVQYGYVPGSIIRKGMLVKALEDVGESKLWSNNLQELSLNLSTCFWSQGDGNRVHINPNTTYVTTEKYVNDLCPAPNNAYKLEGMFAKEGIS